MTEQPAAEHCRSCSARVLWCTSATTLKPMPVNYEPETGGTIAVDYRDGRRYARVVDAKHAFGRTDLRKSHFATCPQAGSWRRKKAVS